MKLLTCLLTASCFFTSAQGGSNFVNNPDLPYPPGCAGDPARSLVPFMSDVPVVLRDVARDRDLEVRLDGFRSTCSEPGRSLIWLRFDATRHAALNFKLELPGVRVTPATGATRTMHLVAAPNGWGSDSNPYLGRKYLTNRVYQWSPPPAELSWLYVLDNANPTAAWPQGPLLATEYNEDLTLNLVYPPDTTLNTLHVPATADLLDTEVGIPLSGRLSGTWVIAGAKDQGIAISISNRVGTDTFVTAPREDLPLVLFLAQYTYDEEGRLLWLTGSADFTQGSDQVSLNMVRVRNGEFMGDTPAARDTAGTVRLIANGCDDITFEYDYSPLGLGAGSHRLQRIFSLETAGHDCRDYAAKVAANK